MASQPSQPTHYLCVRCQILSPYHPELTLCHYCLPTLGITTPPTVPSLITLLPAALPDRPHIAYITMGNCRKEEHWVRDGRTLLPVLRVGEKKKKQTWRCAKCYTEEQQQQQQQEYEKSQEDVGSDEGESNGSEKGKDRDVEHTAVERRETSVAHSGTKNWGNMPMDTNWNDSDELPSPSTSSSSMQDFGPAPLVPITQGFSTNNNISTNANNSTNINNGNNINNSTNNNTTNNNTNNAPKPVASRWSPILWPKPWFPSGVGADANTGTGSAIDADALVRQVNGWNNSVQEATAAILGPPRMRMIQPFQHYPVNQVAQVVIPTYEVRNQWDIPSQQQNHRDNWQHLAQRPQPQQEEDQQAQDWLDANFGDLLNMSDLHPDRQSTGSEGNVETTMPAQQEQPPLRVDDAFANRSKEESTRPQILLLGKVPTWTRRMAAPQFPA